MRALNSRSALLIGKIALFTALLSACGGGDNNDHIIRCRAPHAGRSVAPAFAGNVRTDGGGNKPVERDGNRGLVQRPICQAAKNAFRLYECGASTCLPDRVSAKTSSSSLSGNRRSTATISCASAWLSRCRRYSSSRTRTARLPTIPRGVAHYYDMLGSLRIPQFPRPAGSGDAAPHDGELPERVGQPENRGHASTESRIMRARSCSCLPSASGNSIRTVRTPPFPRPRPTPATTSRDWPRFSPAGAGPDRTKVNTVSLAGKVRDPNRDWLPMQNYPDYHETLPKSFLGVTIPANTSGEASLKIALDTLFNHPNVGPFIGRELIQRLVTSNPSPAYVGRVAAAFANNGQGVRGDMKAVIKAVLLDPEAQDGPDIQHRRQIARARHSPGQLDARIPRHLQLGPFPDGRARTIRCGDWPRRRCARLPCSISSARNTCRRTPISRSPNKFSPEMQITEEMSVTGYLNFMRDAIQNGTGISNDIKADYTAELALAGTPELLVDRINLLLMQNQMSATLRSQILTAINSNPDNTKINRVYLAIFLTMASPEYIVQK